MQVTIDGVRWRLRFRHTRKPQTSGNRGTTQCFVEVWEKHVELEGWFSVPGAYGETTCSRKDNFTRETGRQYALIRALRAMMTSNPEWKPVISALIHSYITSLPKGRTLVDDLWLKGFKSLYNAVFDPDKLWDYHATAAAELAELESALMGEDRFTYCEPCDAWHLPEEINCVKLHQSNPVDSTDTRRLA